MRTRFWRLLLFLACLNLGSLPLGHADTTYIQNVGWAYAGFPKWLAIVNVYLSDDAYAYTSFRDAILYCEDFGFNGVLPVDCNISEVYVGLEMYMLSYESVEIAITVNGGGDWSDWSEKFTLTTEGLLWINVTKYQEDWERLFLLDQSWGVRVAYRKAGGGGCYPNNMYFACTDNLNQAIKDVRDWEFYTPVQIQEALKSNKPLYILSWDAQEGWLLNERCQAVAVDVHTGNYTLYDVYSGELNIDFKDNQGIDQHIDWKSHIQLTGEHNVSYSLNGDVVKSTVEQLYDYWRKGNVVILDHLWYNFTSEPFAVTDIRVTEHAGNVYNVWVQGELGLDKGIMRKGGKTLTTQEYNTLMTLKAFDVPVGKYPPYLFIMTKEAWTAYMDVVQTRVVCIEVEVSCGIACLFIGLCFFSCLVGYVIFSSKHKR